MRFLVFIWVVLSGLAPAAQTTGPAPPWREVPTYLPLLAPAGDRAAAYRIYVSPLDIVSALRQLEGDTSLVRAPGAWQAQPVPPADAFGQAGRYDRSSMARLFGAQAPMLARGARMADGHVVEAWTLVGPYPDPSLRRLEAGTLLIVLRLP